MVIINVEREEEERKYVKVEHENEHGKAFIFSLRVALYKQLQQEPHHTASEKEQDINRSY
jgi:hypothetical protein